MIDEDVKKTIEDLLEGIDEFDSKYMTYKSKTHREFLKKTLNYIKHKEQEYEALKDEIAFGSNGKLSDEIRALIFKNLNAENLKYKQALDEIEKLISGEVILWDEVDKMTTQILNIINKVKDSK